MSDLEGTNFTAWIASEDEGKPICLGGADGGLSVTAYYDEEDAIKGVLVYDDTELVSVTGWVPSEVFKTELEWTRDHV